MLFDGRSRYREILEKGADHALGVRAVLHDFRDLGGHHLAARVQFFSNVIIAVIVHYLIASHACHARQRLGVSSDVTASFGV